MAKIPRLARGSKAVVNRQLVGKISPAARGLDRVHVADHVGDGHVRRGQFFHVALVAREPGDRRGVAFGGDALAAGAAERTVGIVVDLAAGDHGDLRVEKSDQPAQDSRLGLSAQAEQDEMMPRKDRR